MSCRHQLCNGRHYPCAHSSKSTVGRAPQRPGGSDKQGVRVAAPTRSGVPASTECESHPDWRCSQMPGSIAEQWSRIPEHPSKNVQKALECCGKCVSTPWNEGARTTKMRPHNPPGFPIMHDGTVICDCAIIIHPRSRYKAVIFLGSCQSIRNGLAPGATWQTRSKSV